MTKPHPCAGSHRTLAPALGPQNQLLATAVSEELCGSQNIGAGYVAMTGGHHTRAHSHNDTEQVVVVVKGWAATLYGDHLEHTAIHGPGDYIYINPGVPHAAVNLSRTELVRAVEVRTDRHFNSDVQQRPDLDHIVAERASQLRDWFATELLPPMGFDPCTDEELAQLASKSIGDIVPILSSKNGDPLDGTGS